MTQQFSTGIYSEELLCSRRQETMFIAALFITTKTWTAQLLLIRKNGCLVNGAISTGGTTV